MSTYVDLTGGMMHIRTRLLFFVLTVLIAVFTTSIGLTSSAFAQSATQLSTGDDSSCAVVDKKAMCWGSNASGKLGNNSSSNASSAVPVYAKAAYTETIPARCNGIGNTSLCLGTVEPEKKIDHASTPLAGKSVEKISVGKTHACAVAHARVYCWGDNSKGQLGDFSNNSSRVPVDVYAKYAYTVPAHCEGTPGIFGCAITATWINEKKYPDGVLRDKEVIDVAAGNGFTCALSSDGRVACWGLNDHGQLGTGNRTNSNHPMAVDGSGLSGKKVQRLARLKGDVASMCVITTDERAVCWGRNDFGEVGDGRHIPSKTLKASGKGHNTNAGRCAETNKEALASIKKSGEISLEQVDALSPVAVSTNQRFSSIDITARGDSIVTVSSDFNPGNREGTTSKGGEGYAYVTARTAGSSPAADRAFYWGGGYSCDFKFQCKVNHDYRDNDGSGGNRGSNESTDTTATINAYQFGRATPTGPLYASEIANQLRNQPLALVSGNGFVGSNYEQLKQCLSRTEYGGLFGLVKTVVNTCEQSPPDISCAVTQGQQDAAYCDTGVKVCTGLLWSQTCAAPLTGPKKVSTAGTSWLQPTMKISNIDTGFSGYTCAIANGTVGCWGKNNKGQLGDGTTVDRSTPVKVKNV